MSILLSHFVEGLTQHLGRILDQVVHHVEPESDAAQHACQRHRDEDAQEQTEDHATADVVPNSSESVHVSSP